MALDADGNGQFIAMTENGNVIAHDFITTLKRVRRRVPLEFRFPSIRRLDQERFLVVDSRSRGDHNGRVFDLEGQELDSFHLGDAIEDILVFPDKIVAMYHEEGIYGNLPPSAGGLVVFSHDGKQLWGFNDLVGKGILPEDALICDGGPLCRNGTESVLFFSFPFYPKPRLTELRLDNFEWCLTAVPEQVGFATALSPIGETEIIFHLPLSSYLESGQGKFFWWDWQTDDLEELPGEVSYQITGIGNGRFLARSHVGYMVIDPLA